MASDRWLSLRLKVYLGLGGLCVVCLAGFFPVGLLVSGFLIFLASGFFAFLTAGFFVFLAAGFFSAVFFAFLAFLGLSSLD